MKYQPPLIGSLILTLTSTVAIAANDTYVRLTVAVPTAQLKDDGNVFGQLPDSVLGYDSHDLFEIPPMAPPYLTLVFPHPEWKSEAGNYASDFHSINSGADSWQFAVLCDSIERTVTLSWSGNSSWISQSELIDKDLQTTIVVKPNGSYDFSMNGKQQRNFVWNLRPKH